MDKNSSCAVKTKNKMALTLKELMNTTQFEKITVSDITENSGVHRQTFYYHFQDRYELLDWLIYKELLEPFIDGFSFNNMYDKFYFLFKKMKSDKRFYQSAIKISSADIMGFISRLANEQLSIALKQLGKEKNIVFANDKDNSLISEFFAYGVSGVVMCWAQKGMKETPEEMTKKIKELFDVCKQVITR